MDLSVFLSPSIFHDSSNRFFANNTLGAQTRFYFDDENDLNETLPDQIMMCIHQYVGESNLGISSADGLRSALVNHYDSKGLAYQGLFTVHQGVYSGNPAQSKIVSCFILNQFNIL